MATTDTIKNLIESRLQKAGWDVKPNGECHASK